MIKEKMKCQPLRNSICLKLGDIKYVSKKNTPVELKCS